MQHVYIEFLKWLRARSPEVDPEVQALIDGAQQAQQAAAKARAKSKAKPGDEEPPAAPVADLAVEGLVQAPRGMRLRDMRYKI